MKKSIAILVAMALISSALTFSTVFAAESTDTEIGYQMKPLQERLSSLTSKEIEGCIARFRDIKNHWCRS